MLTRPNLNQHEYRKAKHPAHNKCSSAVLPQMSAPQADEAKSEAAGKLGGSQAQSGGNEEVL
jgi:hypothetical protein